MCWPRALSLLSLRSTPALHLLRIEARKTDGKRLTRAEAQPVLDKLNADVFALEDKFDRALAFARKPRIAPVFVHGQVDETTVRPGALH